MPLEVVKTIPSRGFGRPDYSQDVTRTVQPTFYTRAATGTLPIAGAQSEYFVSGAIGIGASEEVAFVFEQGFNSTSSFVPSGQRLILERVEMTAARNSLFRGALQISDGVTNTQVGRKYGYQNVTIEVGKFKEFSAGTRPRYLINNYDATSSITFEINVYGVVESVVT